jgi:hypothetical protein
MNRNVKLAVFFVLGALIVSAASAYVLLSPRRTWASVPTLIVDSRGNSSITDSDGGGTAVVNALTASAAWNGAGTGTRIAAVRGSVATWKLGDGIPMLNFQDPEHACKGTCLAATFTGFYTGSTINDADIVTNTRQPLTSLREPDGCSGEYYAEGIFVHEVGHLLGLGHTNVSGATMYPSVSACNNGPASIEADDKAGINDLY